MNEKDDERKMT